MNARRTMTNQDWIGSTDTHARDMWRGMDVGNPSDAAHVAHQLWVVSFRSWEKALTGAVALPAAMMVGAAAAALYATAFLERAFDLFEHSLSAIGGSVTRDLEMMRRNGEIRADGSPEPRTADNSSVART